MSEKSISRKALKKSIKEALVEALNEERDLFRSVITEALEDFALIEAIKEGEQTEKAEREQIMDILNGKK